MEKDLVVFSPSHEEWVQFQQVEIEAGEGPPGRENVPSKGWEAQNSGCVQGRMSVQILGFFLVFFVFFFSESTARALFVSRQPEPGSLQ